MLRFRNLISLLVYLAISSVPLEAATCPPGPNLADTDGDGMYD